MIVVMQTDICQTIRGEGNSVKSQLAIDWIDMSHQTCLLHSGLDESLVVCNGNAQVMSPTKQIQSLNSLPSFIQISPNLNDSCASGRTHYK